MKIKRLFLFILIISTPAYSASGGQRQTKWKGTMENTAGMIVVKNPKQPMYKEEVCTIREDLSIGKAEGQEEYMFARIQDIAVDDNGDIYVADAQATQIKVFDSKGIFLRLIGRKGQGPGEFTGIHSIQITAKNELMLYDNWQHKLVYFSLTGKFIRSLYFSISLGAAGKLWPSSPLFCDSHENYYIVTGIMEITKTPKAHEEILKIGPDLMYATIAKTPDHDPTSKSLSKYSVANLYCHLMAKDYILMGNSEYYEVQILNPEGKVVRKFSKEYEPIPLSKAEKDKEKKRPGSEGKIVFPRFHAPISYLAADNEGRIFVCTWEKPVNGKGYFFDIYDPEGKYITKIPMDFSPRILKKGNLYAIEADKDSFQTVKRYKITWKI